MSLRLDAALVAAGLAPSRTRARALIAAGVVTVDGQPAARASGRVVPGAELALTHDPVPYVSRAALKLAHALATFGLGPAGATALDLGASTGGFTELLLERGARRVIALDVGHNQLDWKLRSDPRVLVFEGVNARHLQPGDLPFSCQLATMDLSFISLRLVVPAVLPLLDPGAHLVCLVKPQFEAGREEVGKGGIVRDEATRRSVIDGCVAALQGLGLELLGLVPSPIRGQKGNLEELAALRIRE